MMICGRNTMTLPDAGNHAFLQEALQQARRERVAGPVGRARQTATTADPSPAGPCEHRLEITNRNQRQDRQARHRMQHTASIRAVQPIGLVAG